MSSFHIYCVHHILDVPTKSDIVGLESLVWLLCSRWIATPLAASAGIKPRVHLKAEDNPILETYYTTQSRNPPQVNKACNAYEFNFPSILCY